MKIDSYIKAVFDYKVLKISVSLNNNASAKSYDSLSIIRAEKNTNIALQQWRYENQLPLKH